MLSSNFPFVAIRGPAMKYPLTLVDLCQGSVKIRKWGFALFRSDLFVCVLSQEYVIMEQTLEEKLVLGYMKVHYVSTGG